jgi:HlyD family secretion protein
VLRVGNAALRFKPPGEEAAPAQAETGRGGGLAADLPRVARAMHRDAKQQAEFGAALTAMRERSAARAAARPASGTGGSVLFGGGRGGPGGPGGAGRGGGGAGGDVGAMRQRMQERFNQQFAAFRATLSPAQQARWDSEISALVSARRAPLYKLVAGKPVEVVVRVGASDGTWTEVSGDVAEGDEVIIGTERATP